MNANAQNITSTFSFVGIVANVRTLLDYTIDVSCYLRHNTSSASPVQHRQFSIASSASPVDRFPSEPEYHTQDGLCSSIPATGKFQQHAAANG
jgi:hypothetical protein